MVWITSDWHLFHKNIIKYCNRPFNNEYEMTECLIRKVKEKISPNDTLLVLGDITIKSSKKWMVPLYHLIASIPGKKILVKGNHDLYHLDFYREIGFKYIVEFITIQDYIFVHDPSRAFGNRKVICGHVHEKWKTNIVDGRECINVGVDQWNFEPVKLSEIINNSDSIIKFFEEI